VRTRCVTLLLCAVCGLNLHAGTRDAQHVSGSTRVTDWRPLDPAAVFTAECDPANTQLPVPWRPRSAGAASTIANCRLDAAPEFLDAGDAALTSAPSNSQIAICNLQFAIPFERRDCLQLVDSNDDQSLETPVTGPAALSVRNDVRGFLPGVWRDAKGIARSENILILGGSLAAAIGIRQDLDDQVRHDTAAHPERWGETTTLLGHLGEAPVQVPILALVWGTSLWTGDAELNGLTHTLISAYTINGLSVLLIKGIADTDRPDPDWNGGRWGFPSFHAASSFAIAGVLEEYYGWRAGLPAYTLAGLISWSRVDERDHDLSDVVFGAALGWVIGKSVAGTHLRGDGRAILLPWSHPYEPAQGVALEVRF